MEVRIETPNPLPRVTLDRTVTDLAYQFRESFGKIPGSNEPSALYGLSGSIEILDKLQPEWRTKFFEEFRHVQIVTKQQFLVDSPPLRRNTFLGRLLRASWSKDTCSSLHRGSWSSAMPERGQSGVTAVLLNKLLGGGIRQYAAEGYGLYFSNQLENGEDVDLTRAEYLSNVQLHPKRQLLDGDYLLDGNQDYARAADVQQRYVILEGNFVNAAMAMALACASLPLTPSSPPPASDRKS